MLLQSHMLIASIQLQLIEKTGENTILATENALPRAELAKLISFRTY
jgi:hypothetical protein